MNSTALAASEPNVGAGPVHSYPETRIGAFDFYVATCTEPLGYGSADGQRACGDSWRGVTEDLFLFSQEDPIGFAGGQVNFFQYAAANPAYFADAYGLASGPKAPSAAPRCGTCPPDKRRFFDWLAGPLGEMATRLSTDPDFLLNLAAREGGWTDENLDHNMPLNNPFGVNIIRNRKAVGNRSYETLEDAIEAWEDDWGPIVKGAKTRENFVHRLIHPPKPKAPYNSVNPKYEDEFLQIDIVKWRKRCGVSWLPAQGRLP